MTVGKVGTWLNLTPSFAPESSHAVPEGATTRPADRDRSRGRSAVTAPAGSPRACALPSLRARPRPLRAARLGPSPGLGSAQAQTQTLSGGASTTLRSGEPRGRRRLGAGGGAGAHCLSRMAEPSLRQLPALARVPGFRAQRRASSVAASAGPAPSAADLRRFTPRTQLPGLAVAAGGMGRAANLCLLRHSPRGWEGARRPRPGLPCAPGASPRRSVRLVGCGADDREAPRSPDPRSGPKRP